jgi:tRNA (guanine-N7-)-methyltransferase
VCYGALVESDVDIAAREKYARAPRLPERGPIDVKSLLGGHSARVEIEIGPGRGGFMLGRLGARSDVGLIGFEIKRKWVVLVNERLARHGLAERGRVFAEDVRIALPRLGPDGSVAALYLHFPDPWWKKRHQKRLVLGTDVLDQTARLLGPGGELFVQTDVEERAELYETHILAHPAFVARGDSPASARVLENPYAARSHREVRAIADAIPIYRLRFAKKADGTGVPRSRAAEP